MRISKNNFIYFVIIFITILYKYLIIWKGSSLPLIELLIVFAGILSFFILLKKKYNKTIIKKILIIFIFFLITYYAVGTIDIIVSLLYALLFYDEKNGDREFIKIFVLSSATLFFITLLLYCTGSLNSTSSQRLVNNSIEIRNSLGFTHVNSVFMYFMPIILGIYYLIDIKNFKTKFVYLLVVDTISAILYSFTLCRTGIILIIFLNILMIFEKFICTKKIVKLLIKYKYIFFTILTLCVCFAFGSDYTNPINKLFSFRLSYISEAFQTYGIKLIGFGEKKVLIDNGYITILLSYGLLPFIFYFYFSMKTFSYFIQDNKKLIILIIFSIYLLLENNVVYATNFILALEFIAYLNLKKKVGMKQNEKDWNNNLS